MFGVGVALDPKELKEHGHAAILISHVSIVVPFCLGSGLALLLFSLGRHQICSSFSDSTHVRKRGQYCSKSFPRENLRNSIAIVFSGISGL